MNTTERVKLQRVNKYNNPPIIGQEKIDKWFNEFLKPFMEIAGIVDFYTKNSDFRIPFEEIEEICVNNEIGRKLWYIFTTMGVDRQDVFKNSDNLKLAVYTECASSILGNEDFMSYSIKENELLGEITCIIGQLVKPSEKWLSSTFKQKVGQIKKQVYGILKKKELEILGYIRTAKNDPYYVRNVIELVKGYYNMDGGRFVDLCARIHKDIKFPISAEPKEQFEYLDKNYHGEEVKKAIQDMKDVCGYSVDDQLFAQFEM